MEYKIYGKTKIGKNCVIQPNVIIGMPSKDLLNRPLDKLSGAIIGDNCVIRSGSVIYSGVRIGNEFKTGHNVVIRERTKIGNNVLIGTNSIVENNCKIGNNVSTQSNVYIPTNTTIGDFVFIGPNACLTNDKYPVRIKTKLKGPIISKGVSIGANSTLLPEIKIGIGAMVAAGAVVTKDISSWSVAIGSPAREFKLPKKLRKLNKI
jgi:acetyltransferase-like isoleucine patch superfamily enzyme